MPTRRDQTLKNDLWFRTYRWRSLSLSPSLPPFPPLSLPPTFSHAHAHTHTIFFSFAHIHAHPTHRDTSHRPNMRTCAVLDSDPPQRRASMRDYASRQVRSQAILQLPSFPATQCVCISTPCRLTVANYCRSSHRGSPQPWFNRCVSRMDAMLLFHLQGTLQIAFQRPRDVRSHSLCHAHHLLCMAEQ
jgi:hypothetical protein